MNELKKIHLYPTMSCPLNCEYCYVNEVNQSNEQLDFSIYEKLLEEAYSLHVDLVDIAGGEPLVYKNIEQLLKLLQTYKLNTRLVTNGLFLDRIFNMEFDFNQIDLHVSIDSNIEEQQDKVRNYRGLYKKLKKNIVAYNEFFEKKLTANVVLYRGNHQSLNEILRYCMQLGMAAVDIQPVLNVSTKTVDSNYSLSIAEFLEVYQKLSFFHENYHSDIVINLAIPAYLRGVIRNEQKSNTNHKLNHIYIYGKISDMPFTHTAIIKYNGDVTGSTTLINDHKYVIGNVKNDTLRNIWNSVNSMEIRQNIEKIRNQIYDHNCRECNGKRLCSAGDIGFINPYIVSGQCLIKDELMLLEQKNITLD